MCYYILPESGVHLTRKLVQPFYHEDIHNPDFKKRLKAFGDKIAAKIANNDILVDSEDSPERWHLDANDTDSPHLPYDPDAKITEAY